MKYYVPIFLIKLPIQFFLAIIQDYVKRKYYLTELFIIQWAELKNEILTFIISYYLY